MTVPAHITGGLRPVRAPDGLPAPDLQDPLYRSRTHSNNFHCFTQIHHYGYPFHCVRTPFVNLAETLICLLRLYCFDWYSCVRYNWQRGLCILLSLIRRWYNPTIWCLISQHLLIINFHYGINYNILHWELTILLWPVPILFNIIILINYFWSKFFFNKNVKTINNHINVYRMIRLRRKCQLSNCDPCVGIYCIARL